MEDISPISIKDSLKFLYEFLEEYYSRAELAAFLGKPQSTISRKITNDRWSVAEIVDLFYNKRFHISFKLDPPKGAYDYKYKRSTFSSIESSYLRFLQEYMYEYHVTAERIQELTGQAATYFSCLKNNDMRWSTLLRFVYRLGVDLLVDVKRKTDYMGDVPQSVTRKGGRIIVTNESKSVLYLSPTLNQDAMGETSAADTVIEQESLFPDDELL